MLASNDHHWATAAKALESYGAVMKQTPWASVEKVCMQYEPLLAAQLTRLPHNAPTHLLNWQSSTKLPDFMPATPFKMVRELMSSLAAQLRIEAVLAPEDFARPICVASSLAQCEVTAVELADLLSSAPDWRFVQIANWYAGETLERFTSFLRWESSLVRERTGSVDMTPSNIKEIQAHAAFLVKMGRLVNYHAGFMRGACGTAENPGMVPAVAARCGSAAVALERSAEELAGQAAKILPTLNLTDISLTRVGVAEFNPSVLGRIAAGEGHSEETERRRLVDGELLRWLQERDAVHERYALEEQRHRQERRENPPPPRTLPAGGYSLSSPPQAAEASSSGARRGHFMADEDDQSSYVTAETQEAF